MILPEFQPNRITDMFVKIYKEACVINLYGHMLYFWNCIVLFFLDMFMVLDSSSLDVHGFFEMDIMHKILLSPVVFWMIFLEYPYIGMAVNLILLLTLLCMAILKLIGNAFELLYINLFIPILMYGLLFFLGMIVI